MDWRRERENAYLVFAVMSDKDRPSKYEVLPLPFDDELHEKEKELSDDEVKRIEQEHAATLRMWSEDNPFKKK